MYILYIFVFVFGSSVREVSGSLLIIAFFLLFSHTFV